MLYETGTAMAAGNEGPCAIRAILGYRAAKRATVFGGFLVGLSRGSPDAGVSIGGGYRF